MSEPDVTDSIAAGGSVEYTPKLGLSKIPYGHDDPIPHFNKNARLIEEKMVMDGDEIAELTVEDLNATELTASHADVTEMDVDVARVTTLEVDNPIDLSEKPNRVDKFTGIKADTIDGKRVGNLVPLEIINQASNMEEKMFQLAFIPDWIEGEFSCAERISETLLVDSTGRPVYASREQAPESNDPTEEPSAPIMSAPAQDWLPASRGLVYSLGDNIDRTQVQIATHNSLSTTLTVSCEHGIIDFKGLVVGKPEIRTIYFYQAFSTDETIDISVNGQSIAQVPFNTDSATTIADAAALVNGLTGITAEAVASIGSGSADSIIITGPDDQTILTIVASVTGTATYVPNNLLTQSLLDGNDDLITILGGANRSLSFTMSGAPDDLNTMISEVQYTPNESFSGFDPVRFTVSDANGVNRSTVFMNVKPNGHHLTTQQVFQYNKVISNWSFRIELTNDKKVFIQKQINPEAFDQEAVGVYESPNYISNFGKQYGTNSTLLVQEATSRQYAPYLDIRMDGSNLWVFMNTDLTKKISGYVRAGIN